MTKSQSVIIKLLRDYMIDCYDNDDIECSINDLYYLTSALNISTIIGYILNKKGIKDQFFEKSIFKSINKYERLLKARNDLDSIFNSNINYVYIKGLTLAKYYPEPYLRYSSDIDVVVKKDINIARSLLEKAGYKCVSSNSQEFSFTKNGISIDLHRTFAEENEKIEKVFENIEIKDHELDINYKYLYLLVHCMKHVKYGQLEFRFFVDLFYLRKLINKDVINSLLKECNLSLFNDKLNNYLDVILNNKEHDDLANQIENFIFQYAEDSGSKNRVLINSDSNLKIKYLLSRFFIPYNKMCFDYPILKKVKILLPFCYVARLFKPLKVKRVKYTFNEVISNFNKNTSNINDMHDFIDNMGINKKI